MLGIAEDINTRKEVEREVAEKDERWRLALLANNDGVFDWSTKGNIYYSQRYMEMLGYSEKALSDGPDAWFERVHPGDRQAVTDQMESCLEGRTASFSAEYRVRHCEGSYRWIYGRALAARDGEGRVIRVVGSHSDISDRRRAEEARRESEGRYRQVVEQASDLIYRTDAEGRFLFYNGAACSTLGCNAEELIGTLSIALVHPDYQ